MIFALISPVSWISPVDTDFVKTGLFFRFGMDAAKLTSCSFLILVHPSDINATAFDSAIYSPIMVFCFSNALSRRRVASSLREGALYAGLARCLNDEQWAIWNGIAVRKKETKTSSNHCCNALSMWSIQAVNFLVTSATSEPSRARCLSSGVHKGLSVCEQEGWSFWLQDGPGSGCLQWQ